MNKTVKNLGTLEDISLEDYIDFIESNIELKANLILLSLGLEVLNG